MKRIWIPIVLLLFAGGAYLLFLHEKQPPSQSAKEVVQSYVAAEGKVEAMPGFDVDLGTGELNGKVAKILVREGDNVQEGQLVAMLENGDLRAQVTAAQRGLAVAESRLKEVQSGARPEEIRQAAAALDGATAARDEAGRMQQRFQELRAQGMVSAAALDEKVREFRVAQAKTREAEQQLQLLQKGPKRETVTLYRNQLALARADLEHSKSLLDKTFVRSPIAGTVIKRYLDEGEGITPEIPILAIANMDRIWINAEVDETDVGKLHVGDPAEVTADAYRGTIFRGTISQIASYAGQRRIKPNNPSVNLGLKVVEVKIELKEKTPLRLGMSVNVRITPHKL